MKKLPKYISINFSCNKNVTLYRGTCKLMKNYSLWILNNHIKGQERNKVSIDL